MVRFDKRKHFDTHILCLWPDLIFLPKSNPGFLHARSFSSSSDSATTALWVNQELVDSGSDSISSVLRLKRVESNSDSTKTTAETRREKINDAATSFFTVEKFDAGNKKILEIDSDIPNVVHCKQQGLGNAHAALPLASCVKQETHRPQHWNDSYIAAGLLLSLADAAA